MKIKVKFVGLAAAMLMVVFPFEGDAFAAGNSVRNPDPLAVFLMQQARSHTTPSFDELALASNEVREADEFHRKAAIERFNQNIRALAAQMANITVVMVNMNCQISEYDNDHHEYDLDLNDGSFISYDVSGHNVQLALTNGTTAQAWSLSESDAESILRRNRGSRFVTLVLTLSLMDSPPAVDGQPLILNARVMSYDVLAGFGSVRLGHVDVR